MLQEIAGLGFTHAELSHGIRISLVTGIFEAVDAGEIAISSLHNFCPLPMGVNHAAPNVFKFTADNPRERENAFKHTLRTLDFAVRVRAPLVVLHLGCLDMKDYTDKLLGLVEAGKKDTPKYEKLFGDVLMKREDKKELPVQHAYEMLGRLIPEAEKRGIVLGIENREAVEEIPFETDFPLFFKEFTSPAVKYWHDTGHAQIKENLGLIHHGMHLESLSERLAGFHLHDVQFPGRDHCPPGGGTIDWAALQPMVKPEHLKVFEMGPGLEPEQVSAGVAHLKSIWGDS
jgi:sugar phosphate isomerase/epimerase